MKYVIVIFIRSYRDQRLFSIDIAMTIVKMLLLLQENLIDLIFG